MIDNFPPHGRSKFISGIVLSAMLILFTGIHSCRKINQQPRNIQDSMIPFTVEEASVWFQNNHSGIRAAANVGKRGNSKHHRQRKLYPRWSKAQRGIDPNYFVVECPLNFDVSPGISVQRIGMENLQNNINSLSRLLLLKNKQTGKIRSAIMYIHFKGMPDTTITYGNRKTFSGLIYFTTLNGRFINGWMYENGKITRRSNKRTGRDTTTTSTSLDSLALMDPVEEEGEQCFYYEIRHYERYCKYNTGTGDIVSCTPWQYTYSESHYYCVEFDLPDGGGGGGSTGYIYEEHEELPTLDPEGFEIKIDSLDSCSKAVFNEIIESNSIANIILQFSGDNTPFNWTLKTSDENGFNNTSNSAETKWLNGTANNYVTKIGTNYKNSATKLSIARTILHEAIHAYILSYLDLGIGTFSKEFPVLWNDLVAKKYSIPNDNLEQYQHEEMARNYINTIANALADWDNNQQSIQYYKDLAWGGLFGTDAFLLSSDLTDADRIRISNVNNAEDTNTSDAHSIPCNN